MREEIIQQLRCPNGIAEGIGTFTTEAGAALGDQLVGAYLHGSLARRCFHPATSDVDIIVVTKAPCSEAAVSQVLLAHQNAATPLDATFVTRLQIQRNETPTPIDFLLKPMGKVFRQPESSQDFVINRQDMYECGIALVGPCPRDVAGPVPWGTLAKALEDLLPVILPRFKNPVLMLCRICHAFAKRSLCSKQEAGEWALGEFDQQWRPLLESALWEYAEGVPSASSPEGSLRAFEAYCATFIAEARDAI